MDIKTIHRFLTEHSYWARGISYNFVDQSLEHSFCLGAFLNNEQVGFGRVITDYYTFGWFADFFVVPGHRGKGIAKEMLSYLLQQPWSDRLRRKMLNTFDAHTLYRQFKFNDIHDPSTLLEIVNPDIHLQYK